MSGQCLKPNFSPLITPPSPTGQGQSLLQDGPPAISTSSDKGDESFSLHWGPTLPTLNSARFELRDALYSNHCTLAQMHCTLTAAPSRGTQYMCNTHPWKKQWGQLNLCHLQLPQQAIHSWASSSNSGSPDDNIYLERLLCE